VKREIVINSSSLEVRAVTLEDGVLTEFFVERRERLGLAGNIYKGRVARVLPGMQAAFVEIGLEKAGFLHVSDFREDLESLGAIAEVTGEEEVEAEPPGDTSATIVAQDGEAATAVDSKADGAAKRSPGTRLARGAKGRLPIEQQLRRNQEIIVQIAKEPMGTKGARLTSFISLPGRYLVFTPTNNRIGVSRRIESSEERARLRAVVKEMQPVQGGFIIRTACEGVTKREIQRDITFLTKLWSSILKKSETSPPLSALYNDLDLALRIVRDQFSSDVERLWCDDPEAFYRITDFVQTYMPRLRSRLALYEGKEPICDHFGIEPQLEKALDRKVWLKSGGYLVFDQAEALTVVDVNTGRFVGKRNQDETVVKTNLEAAAEVVRQLRLRNIGGIIVVDFIDMSREGDRRRVTEALRDALKRDKARTTTLKISELGLVEMTRKRTRESLAELLTEACPQCGGRRVVKSLPTIASDVLRSIYRETAKAPHGDMVMVRVNAQVARYLYDHGAGELEKLERRLGVKIVLRSEERREAAFFELSHAPAAA
jgi:ribonuclease G